MRTNPDRITTAWLEKRIGLVNDMLGRPKTQYTEKAGGGLTGNRGHLFIDHAYGGVKVAEMAGGGTGENNISEGYVPKKELNNFINGMIAAIRLIENKRRRNPITEGQLENFVYELDTSGRYELEGALKIAVMESKDLSISPNKRQIYKDLAALIRKELKKFSPSRNPKRRKVAKKKRTVKQRAATKKMLAANRARLRKKTKTARRKTRRNPQKARPGLKVKKKSQLWVVFRCFGRDVQYATVKMGRGAHVGLTGMRSEAAIFKTKPQATNIANYLARNHTGRHMWGIVNEKQTGVQIRNFCEKALAGN